MTPAFYLYIWLKSILIEGTYVRFNDDHNQIDIPEFIFSLNEMKCDELW